MENIQFYHKLENLNNIQPKNKLNINDKTILFNFDKNYNYNVLDEPFVELNVNDSIELIKQYSLLYLNYISNNICFPDNVKIDHTHTIYKINNLNPRGAWGFDSL